jgi:hypothetical protein
MKNANNKAILKKDQGKQTAETAPLVQVRAREALYEGDSYVARGSTLAVTPERAVALGGLVEPVTES